MSGSDARVATTDIDTMVPIAQRAQI